MEDHMLRQLSICIPLVALGAAATGAQEANFDIHRMVLPGTHFEIVVVNPYGSLVIHPIGGELAFATDAEVNKALGGGSSQYPIHAFRVESKGGDTRYGSNVYIVPNAERTPSQ